MYRKRSETTGMIVNDLQDISLRALQVFAAVEETGSLSEAATRLGGSRSSVSQHISNLEKIVGSELFDRARRPMSLTPAGEVVRRHAQRILHAFSEARIELMELSLVSMVELRVGIIDDLDASIAPDVVSHLQAQYPRCQLTVTSGRSDDLAAALTQRQLDLVVTGISPEPQLAYQEWPIVREPFMLVAPKGVFRHDVNWRDQLGALPFIRYHATMPIGQQVAQYLRRVRLDMPALYSFDASRSVFAMMLRSGGWTITTPLCLLDSGADVQHMECFPLPLTTFTRTIRIVCHRDELGMLPEHLARVLRDLMQHDVRPKVLDLATWLAPEFHILADRDDVTSSPASAPGLSES